LRNAVVVKNIHRSGARRTYGANESGADAADSGDVREAQDRRRRVHNVIHTLDVIVWIHGVGDQVLD
jgi:hypothetical protein